MYQDQLIYIANKGQAIAETNYFDTEHAAEGIFFMSINAGAFRLLVPDSQKGLLREMRTGKKVEVYQGPSSIHLGRLGFELLFDDFTDTPFCIHLDGEQVDRMLPVKSGKQTGMLFSVWTRGGMKLCLPAEVYTGCQLPI